MTQDLNTLIRTRYPMRLKPSWTDLYDNLWPIVCLRIGQRSHLNYLFVLKRTTTLSESLQKLRYKCTSNISPSMFGRKSITLLCSNLTGPSCNILNTTSQDLLFHKDDIGFFTKTPKMIFYDVKLEIIVRTISKKPGNTHRYLTL